MYCTQTNCLSAVFYNVVNVFSSLRHVFASRSLPDSDSCDWFYHVTVIKYIKLNLKSCIFLCACA